MRIIHVTDTSIYNFDGISTYINEILEVSEKQNDVSLVLTNTPFGKELRTYGNHKNTNLHVFKCFRSRGKPRYVISFPKGIKKIIEEFNPDLIWIHTIGTLGTKASSIARGKYKVVYTKHCFDGILWNAYLRIPKIFHWFFNITAQHFENKIMSVCSNVIYHLNDISKVRNNPYFSKFISIAPPLSSRFFRDKALRNTKPSTLTFGFCGRAEPDKGIENTFIGLEILKAKYKFSNFKFLFVGDGEEAHRMKEKYPDMDIQITGYIDDVIPYLDTLDVMIISSFQETISLSSLEAYARGVTVFSLPIGYLYEHKEKLDNYFVFRSTDELAKLLYNNLAMKDATKINSNIQLIDNFLIDYARLYKLVIAEKDPKVAFVSLKTVK